MAHLPDLTFFLGARLGDFLLARPLEKASRLVGCRSPGSRGLLPLDERRIWIGFTRVRKTRFKENVLWVANILRDGAIQKPTHIALYDLMARQSLQEVVLEPHGMNIVFSIFPASP